MTDRINLPSGGWVELREPKQVTVRQRRPILALFAKAEEPGADVLAVMEDLTAEIAGVVIVAWSFPVPVSADGYLDSFTQEDADVLQPLLLAMADKIMPSFSVEGAGDPASPTGP